MLINKQIEQNNKIFNEGFCDLNNVNYIQQRGNEVDDPGTARIINEEKR